MAWLGFAQLEGRRHAPSEGHGPSASEEANEVLLALLPWGISLLLHVALTLQATFIVWSVRDQTEQREIIIPSTRLSATPGIPLQPTPLTQSQAASPASKSLSELSRASFADTSASLGPSPLSQAMQYQTVGLTGGAGAAAAQSNPFALGVSAGELPEVTFFGTGGNAKKIAYLVDASGSLIDTLPHVINELKRSINALVEKQRFTVIFFHGDEPLQVPPRQLIQATAENKRHVAQWISPESYNVVPGFGSSPVKAITLALRYQPDLIFILSDNITGEGIYQVDQRRLLREVREANTADTIINTIQFVYPDPLEQYGVTGTLKRISEMTHGEHKYLDERELNLK